MDSINIKKTTPIIIPIVFKKTIVMNTTINKDELDQLLNNQFSEKINVVSAE